VCVCVLVVGCSVRGGCPCRCRVSFGQGSPCQRGARGLPEPLTRAPVFLCWVALRRSPADVLLPVRAIYVEPFATLHMGAVAVASLLAGGLTEIYLWDVCSGQEILRRNGRGQCASASTGPESECGASRRGLWSRTASSTARGCGE
jgi:hypothetical protein